MNVGETMSLGFTCSIVPTQVDVSPLLPAGINKDLNGITGSPQNSLTNTTYTVYFINSDGSTYRQFTLLGIFIYLIFFKYLLLINI